jgi:pyruvate,water dikinase
MTRWLSLDDSLELEEHGGKAVSLGLALRAGLSVPPGLAVPCAAVEAIASGDSTLSAEVAAGAAHLGERALAVRSSAIDEDAAGSSFAGIHDSVLGVRGPEQLRQAITAVWRSAHSQAALSYREQRKIAGAPRIAVIIQACLDPDVAGVMFTRCPVTGADQRVIEGSWGLGEVVVSGLVTPDQFRLDRSGEIVERSRGEKLIARRLSGGSATCEEPVAAADIARLCLGAEELRALHDLAERCDGIYQSRLHDIEWAFEQGRLFLLQRRPITHP